MIPFSRPVCLLLTCGALLPSLAVAADNAIEEVFVSASRTERPLSSIPNTVTVINNAELEQQLSVADDLSTVLGNLIPGFSPSRQKMTNAGETLRGRKPLYMIDGVPQSNPLRDGGREGNTIDPVVIERVEVLHGANAIHGLGASGGVINLITRRPANQLEQSLRISTGFQTEDVGESADYGLSYSLSNRFGDADMIASISLRDMGVAYDGKGQIIGADNTQGDTMDSQSLNLFLKAGYDLSEQQRIELMVNRYKIENNNNWVSVPGNVAEGIPSSAVKGEIYGEGASNEVTALSLNYNHDDFLGHRLRVQGFSQDFAATYGAEAVPLATFQDPAYGPDLIDQSQNNSEKRGLKITLVKDEVARLPLNLVYGVDVLQDKTWQALIQTGRAWVPPSEYKNYAPFLQAEYTGVDKLTLTTGVRYEKSKLQVNDFTTLAAYGSRFVEGGSPEFSETLYNYGGTYQITSAWRVFANYAEAFSMPDVGRVLRAINQPNLSVETFLDLKPVLTESREFGVEFKTGDINAQLSYYTSDSKYGERLQRDADGIYTVQREKTEIDGIEFSLSWAFTDVDVLGVRYAEATGRYDSNNDGRVDSDLGGTNISPDRLNLSWDRTWSSRVDTRLQANYLLDRDVKNSSGVVTNRFEGYTTYDLSATIAAFDGTISLALQNLTDEYYFTYYSQSSPNNIRNFTGVGRSVNLGYQRTF
ncbi:TonB-dependent receptor [Cellvibrio japonicus]|uniref:TonB-dependent ferric achromobactin receptor n=1 Tax=Cellvibrio japonicus (strain Ueda107) TaxID=498211 RepID=B3PHX9_CELJU|nr:TonB-dependent receptor [Cellvibrio japonicus]ACE83467.1 TonB-dependent ferric achromobactin receptor [Cellvibrio japonicus Ueda107]QEI13914.1 TonB-dependent receptor [Cellvibrio japonicus]QEI17488.1 TonB-dependent receptor [Cellvibrio japonicus]QEI21064.1 TonB-dependent receptor [Cellvibrio japonicus]